MAHQKGSGEGRRVQEAAPNPAYEPLKALKPFMGQKGLTQEGSAGRGRGSWF